MNKIREEFESTLGIINNSYIPDENRYRGEFNSCTWNGYQKGRKSRDNELEKWRTRNDKQEAKIIDQGEKIKKLRDACILADKALRNMNLVERVTAEEAIHEALKESE